MSEISDRGSDFIKDLGDAARKNPLSAALIGMGVLWLFTDGRPVQKMGEFPGRTGFDRIPDATGEALDAARSSFRPGASSLRDRVKSAKDALRDTGGTALERAARFGSDYADAASDYVETFPESATEAFETARSNLSELFKAQPLALGVIGLAIGAGIAATLPRTTVESAYFGEASDNVKETSSEIAKEQAARAASLAEKVVSTVTQEARKEGLTVESAKSAIGTMSEKVDRVIDAGAKAYPSG